MSATTRLRLAKCIDVVRNHDSWHFLCTTLLRPEHRPRAFVYYALNAELEQVADKSKKAHFASLKYKWWVDAIDKVNNESRSVPNHPVVSSLPELVGGSRTCKFFLSKLVQSKLEKVEKPLRVVKTLETLEENMEGSYSSMYYLLLESSKVEDLDCLQAASHMGKGVGLSLLLKSIAHDAMNDKVYLPTDLCLKSKVDYGRVTGGYNSDELSDVVFQVASRAKTHLDEARRMHQTLPRDLRPFLLPCIPALRYLERLERAGFAPFTPDLHDNALSDLRLKVNLAWSNFAGKI
ncbi:squalene/phytoene synthase [Chloropicon primus]|uniref:Squalene/phytoene synthase n=1 Tax=Chloropicon primus TaxID=1764295 RepID=A0A5B8MXD3_9CHLO|nr:hypothetical protein A3770_13p68730 [Chloropicon primus]UPR03563.1 squalene/phytoene synthase [Chloropicon primus]|mmetsp:Transcript_12484/g.34762  ORF Transcript_12484/g.34762 Transcript_12484/m.34762 type:complete len:292 (-) Transcript_12484:1497-2372(-)|eukprot:QDZ24355.1 hypothetical protein A3770_13p68730 [Chloropicon primus]